MEFYLFRYDLYCKLHGSVHPISMRLDIVYGYSLWRALFRSL